jgi:hypothetical protein
MDLSDADPKGLVRESYAIEEITAPECRSIFLDWALSLKAGIETHPAIRALLEHYGPGREDHPMTGVMQAALAAPETPRRRGGRAARVGG